MSEQRRNRAGYRSALDRLDEWIRRGGERLAGRGGGGTANGGLSRRGLIEAVGIGAAAAGILSQASSSPEHEQAVCTLPAGCFGTEDVNVCYTPWKVVAAEPGRSDGVVLRKGPSFSADPVTRTDGVTPTVIPIGGHFGRVSNRTGSVSNGCPDPGPRANQNGFLWGYWTGFHRQGWMPYSVGGVTYAVGDTGYTGTMCGPAAADFDCRLAKSACTGYNGCGGAGVGTPTCSETYRPIVAVGTDLSEEKYYLRYGANSTTFFWLKPGDRVKRWGYKDGGTYNWSCVQVICAAYAPNGCRGWVRSDALGSPITDNSPCYPSVSCPSGSSG
jgi:hypothetical protein